MDGHNKGLVFAFAAAFETSCWQLCTLEDDPQSLYGIQVVC